MLHNHGLFIDLDWSKQNFLLVLGFSLQLASLGSLVALGVGNELLVQLIQAVLGRQAFSDSVVVNDNLFPILDFDVRPPRKRPYLLLDPGLVALASTCNSCSRPLTVLAGC